MRLTAMASLSGKLDALAQRLDSAHVVLHIPAAPTALIAAPAVDAAHGDLEALTRHVLWPLACHNPAPQILNRARPRQGAPLLPFRVLLCPLLNQDRAEGLIAALRRHDQARFEESDAETLLLAAAEFRDELKPRDGGQTLIFRRPDFEAEIAVRAQTTEIASVVYINLDQVHAINELSGFAAGDEAIRAAGKLLRAPLLPEGSVAGRLSGDRYAAVLFDCTLNQARAWAEEAREAIAALQLGDRKVRISASLGVALLPRTGTFERALAAAETACRAAKDRGRNRVEIYETGDASIIRRHEYARDSRAVVEALEDDRLVLHAQPIADLRDRTRQPQYEVLLRVRESDGTVRSIGDYLQAVERYQMFNRLDHWVVEHVLRVLRPHTGPLLALGVRFSINITGQSLSDPEFADFVRSSVVRSGVAGTLLTFEFTETAAVRNIAATSRFIRRLADLGAHLALDDFGTGVSSLLHLKELAVHRIKIDGRFIRDILTNTRSEALVRALAQIGASLGLETVGEFIETEAVAAFVHTLGVQYGQGYLFGRARPLEDVLTHTLTATPTAADFADA
jgi:diguanylate cyclase (GGDEF)-like protein